MFLVCGEVLFDVFIERERPNGLTLDARPGGSPFNVALGLARLGQPTEFFAGISSDILGDRLADFIAREGIGLTHSVRKSLPTTLSVVGIGSAGVPAYAFYGEGAADRAVTVAELPQLDEDIRVIHVGSFATAVEPVATALDELVRRESGRRLISYDPNVRPTIEPSLSHWRQCLEAFSGLVQLIKISSEDLLLLYPGADPAEMARRWIARGVRLVVITDGAQGAQAWTQSTNVRIPGCQVTVVDTVGAGDSFQAALLAGLAERGQLEPEQLDSMPAAELEMVIGFAARAAAITCSRRGADLPRRSELPSLDHPS